MMLPGKVNAGIAEDLDFILQGYHSFRFYWQQIIIDTQIMMQILRNAYLWFVAVDLFTVIISLPP